jgi:hypothetical protein
MILDGAPPVNTGDALRHFIKIAAGAVLVFGFYSIPAALLRVFSLTQTGNGRPSSGLTGP